MSTYKEEAKEEIKRADHLLFVTLKYARIADVIYSIIDRLNNACDIIALECIEKSKKIKETPRTSFLKAKAFKELVKGTRNAKQFVELYTLLRKLKANKYEKKGEYRKNVTLISLEGSGRIIEINMEKLREMFDKTIEFIDFFSNLIESKKI